MYGPIFCRQRLLSMYYYKGEKLFRYFKSHCQNRSRKAELMAESFLWFFANWKLTAGCQIVLRRGNAGTVILWLNDSEVSCWKRQKNGCLTRWWCHWSLTSTWPYVSASVCTFQVWQCHQETIDITLLDFLAFICIKKTGGSIDTTTSCVRFSQSSCLYYISNNEFKPVNQHGDSPLCICHIAALCEKLTCHFLFFFCFPAKSFKLNTKCVNVIPPTHTHTHTHTLEMYSQ